VSVECFGEDIFGFFVERHMFSGISTSCSIGQMFGNDASETQ